MLAYVYWYISVLEPVQRQIDMHTCRQIDKLRISQHHSHVHLLGDAQLLLVVLPVCVCRGVYGVYIGCI